MLSMEDADQPTMLRLWIPATADSWAARFEEACSLLERRAELPQVAIRTGYIASTDREEIVENRLAFLQDTLRDPFRQVILSNGRGIRYTRAGAPIDSGRVLVKGNFMTPNQSSFDLSIYFPAVAWSVREQLLAELGDTLQAHSGELTPRRAELTFMDLFRLADWPAQAPGRQRTEISLRPLHELMQQLDVRIPAIKAAAVGGVRESDLQPERLGWSNYWSEATARWLGFPDPDRDRELLQRSQRTAGGAWLVRTTHEPLDLTRAEHVRCVAELYERFPRLGIRFHHSG
ncbi:hypothetical protein JM946_08925 [Steroidobacter sp. S1-65]|uniref:Uncharacterized protein n=1 Tax=Steroidobacter gossypii TaxID=2805490 RepID=A0ABS1WV70_9GAMM|nr:DUF5953 family protein [Steroidobacter gossypii]MBM0104870.1 hypothetical protein [Steroidobacter gossypii]